MAEELIKERLISLDVFRGLTIAGMVLVNNPGTWSSIYGPLKHAEWHGITPTDYIFPFFLFIVGVAVPIALGKRLRDGLTRDVYFKIFRRSALIFVLGLTLSAIPFFDFAKTDIPQSVKGLSMLGLSAALFLLLIDRQKQGLILAAIIVTAVAVFYLAGYTVVPYDLAHMRIPGVLQRIGVCYLIVSLIFLKTSWRQQAVIGIVLLLFYWLLMTVVPVPGCEVTTIDDKACNLAAYIDRLILGEAHIWRSAKVYDPEGILSTIPALVTTISGVLTGTWLLRRPQPETPDALNSAVSRPNSSFQTAAGMFFFGTLLLALGWAWSLVFPLNKSLWTGSYVLYTSGLALLTLAGCYWLIDIHGYKRWTKPFVIFGVNALALFLFSGLMARFLGAVKVAAPDGKEISLQKWIFENIFLAVASPVNASLMYAVSFILLWLLLMWLLYRRRIFIKV